MFDIKENLKKLPDKPGVYMHKDNLGQVIYVGKAVSLRNRVRQYFQTYGKSTPKLRALTSQITEFEYITCDTEMEALILENNLIKKYMPKYNVLLRDDKTYPYIEISLSEEYPRILKTRILKKDGNKYFGPYSDAGAVNTVVELLASVYSLKRCNNSSFPAGFKPCLNYHIKECRGICTGQVSKEDYLKSIEEIVSFLSGKDKKLIRSLEEEMKKAAEEMRFEEGARLRDCIAAAKTLAQTQRVTMIKESDFDVVIPVAAEEEGEKAFILLFYVRDGKLIGRDDFDLQAEKGDSLRALTGEFIKQYYSKWAEVPKEILVEEEPEEKELLEDFLSKEGHKVRIYVPKKGDKRAMLRLAQNDREEMVKTRRSKAESGREKRESLRSQVALVLKEGGWNVEPADGKEYRIESYDISNTNGVDSVGAMVVFQGTRKIRKDYRRFKIKTVEGPDDYASLREMLERRFKRYNMGDPAFAVLPDCIFMDGGQGQVTSAKSVLDELSLDIPVVGMAKDDSHRTRAIAFADGREIELATMPELFRYCGTIQEEVHRFAIEYHRSLRGKSAIKSILDEIPGIGPRRRNALLKHFGSVDEIKKASVEELMEAEGMNKASAEGVKDFFSSVNKES